jgi:hypothetical protein
MGQTRRRVVTQKEEKYINMNHGESLKANLCDSDQQNIFSIMTVVVVVMTMMLMIMMITATTTNTKYLTERRAAHIYTFFFLVLNLAIR